jgi:hypothetical protein
VPLVPLIRSITFVNVLVELLVNGGVLRGTEGYRGVPPYPGMLVPPVPPVHQQSAQTPSGPGAPSTPANQQSATVPLVPLGYWARIVDQGGSALRCAAAQARRNTVRGRVSGRVRPGSGYRGGYTPSTAAAACSKTKDPDKFFAFKFFARRQSLSTIQIF